MAMADKIFINGCVYTCNKNNVWVEAVAVHRDQILAVGTNEEVLKYQDNHTQLFNLMGKLMLPGFIDAHCHPRLAACWLSGVILSVDMTLGEVENTITEHVEAYPEKDSYFGIGYAEWIFDSKGPTKEALDRICKDKPVLILGSSGHEGWANSKALEMAGVDKDYPDPFPGFQYFERDNEGNPTGHLVEIAPTEIIMMAIKPFNLGAIKDSIGEISENYSKMGVTTVADCGSFADIDELTFNAIKELIFEEKFVQRLFGCTLVTKLEEVPSCIERLAELNKSYDTDKFRINVLKIINDGTIESRSASLSEPYDEDQSMVCPMIAGKDLETLFLKAAKAGFNIHIHAIGDRTIHETLMAAKAVREAGFTNTRITNAHTDFVMKEDRPLFGKYDVISNTTGVWHYGNPGMKKIIGDRADQQFMLKSLIDHGAKMSLGSDFPVDEYGPEPLKGMEMGITRQFFGQPDAIILQPLEERLSINQVIEGYTVNAAYQLGMEDKLGSIEAGKYADLVVLEQNIFDVDTYQIHKIPVGMTLQSGKIVYNNEEIELSDAMI